MPGTEIEREGEDERDGDEEEATGLRGGDEAAGKGAVGFVERVFKDCGGGALVRDVED